MTTLEIPNIGTFDIELWEEGEGAALLYLHGYERHPGGAGFLTRLAEDRRVLAPEQPGYGRSTGFENFTDVIDVALYYRELLESLGVSDVDVVGHSLGGMFAAELAAIAPQLVRRLVLVNPFGIWLDDEPTLDPFGPAAEVKAAKWHGEAPKVEPTNFVPDPDDPHAAILFSAQNLGSATKFMWPIADRGLRRRLPLIDAPTLVVHGTEDRMIPAGNAQFIAGRIAGAELRLLPDAGHFYPTEEPGADETIAAFLKN